jgi:hypothetical protein
MIKKFIVFHVKYPLFLSDIDELEFSQQIFGKYSVKFHENPSSGSRVFPRGRTDRRDEANSRSSQFYGSAYKGKGTTAPVHVVESCRGTRWGERLASLLTA